MKLLRLLVLLLLMASFSHTVWAADLSSIQVSNDNYAPYDEDGTDIDSTIPMQMATVQETSSPGQISVRPLRLLNSNSNTTFRHTGKSSFITRILNIRNKKHLRLQGNSSSLGGCVSCDYYVIALRHIIR